jgi:1-acyl-sn-glycerol-3-phosphate acyltransferase
MGMARVSSRTDPGEAQAAERLLAIVRETVAELHPQQRLHKPVSLDTALDKELGLDSLTRVELFSRIERQFDVALPERLFAEAETARDLLRAVLRAKPLLATGRAPDIERLVLPAAEAAPDSATTLLETLDWHVQTHPDRPHIRHYVDEGEGETLSYRRLEEGAIAVAAGLQQLGLSPGEPIGLMLPTGADYFFAFWGILLAGGVPAPMYPPPRPAHLEEHLRRQAGILTNCRASILITMPEAKRLSRLLRAQVETLRHVVSVRELAASSAAFQRPRVGGEAIALLQYTSGSTGNPKGVVLTHANLLANIRAMGQAVDVRADDVFVSWLPLYHDMGLIGAWLGSLYFALPLVIMPPLSFLTRPQRWLWAIHRYRGTLSSAPNFGYELCLRRLEDRDIEGLDLSCWRVAFNGAEAVIPQTVERFAERFRSYGFRPGSLMPVYGLAESSVGLAFPPVGRGALIDRIRRDAFTRTGRAIPADEADSNTLRFVACGPPLPGHQIRVVDEADREVPERVQGHVQFQGPSATGGYYRNQPETRVLFHGDWLDTGDLGYMVGGELYVTGRAKDIIIRAGRNIYPHEVEQAVGAIKGVRRDGVAVFGSPDPASGTERVVVLAETRVRSPDQRESLRLCINGVVSELIGEPPDDVVLAPPNTVPKTSSGKIRRTACRALYERGLIGKPKRKVWWQIARLSLAGLAPLGRRAARSLGEWFFASYAWGVFGLLAPIIWTAVMTLPSFAWRWRIMRGGIRLLRGATRTPLIVQGLDNLPPERKPLVLVANHASYLDGYALIAALPRPLTFIAKEEFARDPLLGEALRRIDTEFVERFDPEKGVSDTRRLARRLLEGHTLMFFAEGTFTRVPGLRPFHLGAFVAAVESGAPVVPVALRGTRSMLRSDSWFPRRGAIHITIGGPLDAAAFRNAVGGDVWKAALRVRDEARAHIVRHCGEPDLAQEAGGSSRNPGVGKMVSE